MKPALLLLNMGGPEDTAQIRLFLKNMFNDKNILGIPQPIRALVAWLITTRRLPHAQANYAKIGGKSPLPELTRQLVAKLQTALPEVEIAYAMRYTPPRIEGVLHELQAAGVTDICLLPLYPQYSVTTTGSSLEDVALALEGMNYNPTLHTVARFYDHPDYIATVAQTIAQALNGSDASEFELIYSAHGLPQKVIDRGDPYEREVTRSCDAVTAKLTQSDIRFNATHLAYQSKVGPMKWLEPSLESTLETMPGKKVIIVPIAFTIDNSETDFELAIEYREVAEQIGLSDYRVCRCPNDSDPFVATLVALYHEAMA